jgi:hypothetical protein
MKEPIIHKKTGGTGQPAAKSHGERVAYMHTIRYAYIFKCTVDLG